jgi:hypothetical protein
MNDEELEKITKMVANESHIMSTPIDFDQLIRDGLLKRIGKSFYTENSHDLPENVRKRITSVNKTKNGIKVTFSKETKSMKKLADKSKQYRD